jgi:hypothetical protein
MQVKGKARGRAASVRCHNTLLESIDEWRRAEPDRPTRAKAIRRLVEQALARKGVRRPLSKEAASKASNLAARELEKLGSQSLPEQELQQRKRTLIRGPKEFRELRTDLPTKQKVDEPLAHAAGVARVRAFHTATIYGLGRAGRKPGL